MNAEATYYSVLKLNPDASSQAVQEAFDRLAARFPKGTSLETDPEYQKLLQAYEVLNDPSRRATYDSLLTDLTSPPLVVTVQTSRSIIPTSKSPQLFYALIEVNPPRQAQKSRRPLNLCLVLDSSTSMQGRRLDFLKTAVELVVEKLAPEDIISIISFSDRAEVVQPPTHVTNKHSIMTGLRGIRASGGTEIYQGLQTGVEQLRQTPLNKYNNQLILLTDGHTYGDAAECINLASRVAGQQIGITAFGLGDEWNDKFLDQLVTFSGGQSAFIEEPTQIIEFLQKRIQGLGTIHARNLRLKNKWSSSLNLQYAFKLLPFAQPLDIDNQEIKLGNIEGKGALSYLLEITIPPQIHEARISMPIEMIVDIPAQNINDYVLNCESQIIINSNPPDTSPPKDLLKAVRVLNMYRMNEKVWEEIEAGNVGVAATRLRHLTTRLLEAGEIKLAQQAHAETERLSKVGTLSADGWKKLKYGTRAMIGETVKMKADDSM